MKVPVLLLPASALALVACGTPGRVPFVPPSTTAMLPHSGTGPAKASARSASAPEPEENVAGLPRLASPGGAAGSHRVKAFGGQDASWIGGGTLPFALPSTAVSVGGVQGLASWRAVHDDDAVTGASSGSTTVVGSPSLSGAARQFVTQYVNSGDERYSAVFASDPAATTFVYDAWIYIASPSDGIANLEMDMNQVISNGNTVIFGFQCDGYSGTWDYTTNAGTPADPKDKWLHSTATCNPRDLTTDTWHHVEVLYSRDETGNVTYHSVWLDGAGQEIEATVPSAFALRWQPVLLTNFQVDGLGAGGTSTVYLDNLTIYRW